MEKFIAETKKELAQVFDVSITTVDNWLTRGLPHSKGKGRNRYTFSIPEVIRWLSLGGQSDGEDIAELSVARARLAVAQEEKIKVETEMRRVQLGQVLSSGVIPVDEVVKLFHQGEVLLMQGVAGMVY